MPFPPSDVVAAFSRHLHFQVLERALRERHPELAERVQFDDSQGRMLLKVALPGGQSICLAHVHMRYAVVWGVMDPDLNSEPFLWPLDTPDDVLVDSVHAKATVHLTGEPLSSPWRWHESEPSAMTELADLLDARGVQVRRVAAGNRYFAYGPRLTPELDIVGERDESFLEAEFPNAFVRVSLKPTLGWLLDLHTPRGGWGRIELDPCLRRTSSPTPGVPRADVSVEEIAQVLGRGPETWAVLPAWIPPWDGEQSPEASGTALPEDSSAEVLPVQGALSEWEAESTERWDGLGVEKTRECRQGPLQPHQITKAVLEQLTTLGFSDVRAGEDDISIASERFHFAWLGNKKTLSTSALQKLNGVASAAGDDVPKRLIVITGAGLTRPAATFANKAKAYVFCLDTTTGRLTALNSLAHEALLPVEAPGVRKLESW